MLWVALAAMLACSAAVMLGGCRQAAINELSNYVYTLDHYFFRLLPAAGLFSAVFASLFLGTEYSDGAMRNKLVVGHSRNRVYGANLLACFSASLLFLAAWFVGSLAGVPFLGTWRMGPAWLAVYLLLAVLSAAAFSGIFTLLGMTVSSKAAGAVLAILLFLGLLVCASMIYNRLCEPEMSSGIIITAEGMNMAEPTPNPNYLSGTPRMVYEFLLDFLPTGQGIQMSNLEVARPLTMALSSVLITAATTIGGMIAFRKKDLK